MSLVLTFRQCTTIKHEFYPEVIFYSKDSSFLITILCSKFIDLFHPKTQILGKTLTAKILKQVLMLK